MDGMHICNCTKVYFADGSYKYLNKDQLAQYKRTRQKPKGGHR